MDRNSHFKPEFSPKQNKGQDGSHSKNNAELVQSSIRNVHELLARKREERFDLQEKARRLALSDNNDNRDTVPDFLRMPSEEISFEEYKETVPLKMEDESPKNIENIHNDVKKILAEPPAPDVARIIEDAKNYSHDKNILIVPETFGVSNPQALENLKKEFDNDQITPVVKERRSVPYILLPWNKKPKLNKSGSKVNESIESNDSIYTAPAAGQPTLRAEIDAHSAYLEHQQYFKDHPEDFATLNNALQRNLGKNINAVDASYVDNSKVPEKRSIVQADGMIQRRYGKPLRSNTGTMITGNTIQKEESVENLFNRREDTISRLSAYLEKMKEGYKSAPTPLKLALSGSLIAAGIAGAATGSGLAIAGAFAGKAVIRGLGAYIAGEAVESYLHKRNKDHLHHPGKANTLRGKVSRLASVFKRSSHSKNDPKEKQTKEMLRQIDGQVEAAISEKTIRNAKWATIISVFMLGSYSDLKELGNMVAPAIEDMASKVKGLFGSMDTSLPSIPEHIPPHEVHPMLEEVVRPVDESVSQVAHPSPSARTASIISDLGKTHVHEMIARKGETLIGVLLRSGIHEAFLPEDIAKLSPQGKTNLILNIVNQLTPEQLHEVGITSGNSHILREGNKINIAKLAELARNMTVTVGGEKISLIKRALGIA